MGLICDQASTFPQILISNYLQAAEADNTITGARGPHGEGYYDYQANMFVMEDGRLAEMVI